MNSLLSDFRSLNLYLNRFRPEFSAIVRWKIFGVFSFNFWRLHLFWRFPLSVLFLFRLGDSGLRVGFVLAPAW